MVMIERLHLVFERVFAMHSVSRAAQALTATPAHVAFEIYTTR